MNKEEIEKLFKRIELDKASDSCGFEFADGYGCNFDNIATCYDDRLKLYELVKDLQKRINKAIKYIETHKRKDEFLNLNEWQTRDLLEILKGDVK